MLFLLCCIQNLRGQNLGITLNVNPNPTAEVLDWAKHPNTVIATITNTTGRDVDYKIKAQLFRNNELALETNLRSIPTQTIGANEPVIIEYVEDIIPPVANSMIVHDNELKRVGMQTQKLPADNYKLCVTLVDPSNYTINLSEEKCGFFNITSYQAPLLLSPVNGSEISTVNGGATNFTWRPITPNYPSPVAYEFQIVEQRQGQSVANAFQTTIPVYNTTLPVGQTVLTYTSDLPLLEEGNNYVWSVKAVDDITGESIGATSQIEGWAEPFFFKEKPTNPMAVADKVADEPKHHSDCPEDTGLALFSYKNLGNNTIEFENLSHSEFKVDHTVWMFGEEGVKPKEKNGLAGIKHQYKKPGTYPVYMKIQVIKKRKKINGKKRDFFCRYHVEMDITVNDSLVEESSQDKLCNDVKMKIALSSEGREILFEDETKLKETLDFERLWTIEDTDFTSSSKSDLHIVEETKEYKVCLNYLINKDGKESTCQKCDFIKVGDNCDAETKIVTQKSDEQYTFINTKPVGFTIESTNWEIKKYGHYASGDTMRFTNSMNRSFKVCMETVLKGEDGSDCTVRKCERVKVPQCDYIECEVSCDDNPSAITFQPMDTVKLCGGFELVLLPDLVGDSNGLSGKGKVYIPWIRADLGVKFSRISINAEKQLCKGEIFAEYDPKAPTYPEQWGINQAVNFEWTDELIEKLQEWLNKTPGKNIDLEEEVQQLVKPVKVPLGINNAEGYTLAFSGFKFTPSRNTLSAVTVVPIDFYDNHTLGFEATNISFSHTGPANPFANGGSGGLDITAPKTINYTVRKDTDNPENFAITFNKKSSKHEGTGLYWTSNCNGKFDFCFRVDADFEMPRRWLKPVPDNGKKVRTNVQTEVCNWKDWIVSVNLPRCELVGTNGSDIIVKQMTYDHSQIRNVQGMQFPKGWELDETTTFRGFWLKQGKLILPEEVSTYSDPNQRVEIEFNNWIIHNKYGITGEVLAKNIVNFPDGNIADLGGSIDTVKINVVNSSLTTAYMKGKVILPVANNKPANALNYKALFGRLNSKGDKGFQFNLKPERDIESKFFASSKLELKKTSYMELWTSDGVKRFDLILNGEIEFPDSIKNKVGLASLPIDLKTKFEKLGVNYNNTREKKLEFKMGTWSLASPQKRIFKFPATIKNFRQVDKAPEGKELYAGGIAFDAIVNLAQNRIGGTTTFELIGSIDKPTNEPIQPSFKKATLSAVEIRADLAAVKMQGSIDFISKDPVYGDGLKGELSAKFKSLNTSVGASVFFGNTVYQSSSRYRYWKVEAKAILPPPGVPFLPGLAFRGFGAGAYHHMKANFDDVKLDVNNPSNTVLKGATFIPNRDIQFGFKALGVMASTPKEAAFNADVGLAGEFSRSGGMTFIQFDGDFWVGASLLERDKAITYGDVLVRYDFPERIFDLGANVNINKKPISTPRPINMALHINGTSNKWYFKLGEPNNLNTVKLGKASVQQYLMFGNDIYAPSGFMRKTINGLSSVSKSLGMSASVQGQVVNGNTITGNGLAFGIGASFDTGNKKKKLAGRVGVGYRFSGGFEVNSALMQYDPSFSCGGYSPVGLSNGWRANGGVAAYAKASAGIVIYKKKKRKKRKKRRRNKDRYFHLADLALGAWLYGEFPQPSYLAGAVGGRYRVLGGLFKGRFNANFKYGTKCNGNVLSNQGNFAQEDAAEEQRKELIASISIENGATNIPTTSTIGVQYGFTPNQAFDAAEMQANGSVKNRVFQVLYTTDLVKVEGSTLQDIPLKERIDGLGVYQYRIDSQDEFISNKNLSSRGTLTSGVRMNDEITSSTGQGVLPNTQIGLQNQLEPSTSYQFTVVGTLYEQVGEKWEIATNQQQRPITQKQVIKFSTAN